MHSIDRELERFGRFLDSQGQKLTRERSALVREIFGSHYHFDADELLIKMKEKGVKISRATIYRSLELLVRSGMVRRVHLGEEHYHYERVTRNAQHHDHLVCTTCGSVIEFHDPVLEKKLQEICDHYKLTPTSYNLQILGICERCHRRGEQPDVPDRVKMIQAAANRLRK